MAQLSPQVSEVLKKALALSTQDRGLVIDCLIASLDEGPPDEGVEEAWAEEIKRRVDDIRSGKVKMIPGEEVRRRLAARLLDGGTAPLKPKPGLSGPPGVTRPKQMHGSFVGSRSRANDSASSG